MYVPDVILERKERKRPLLWKTINTCGHKHIHTHTRTHTHTHTHTDMDINTQTYRSITIKAVGIKYKDATNLQIPLSLK